MIKVKIVGAGGYGGLGILQLLLPHPEVKVTTLVAKENIGKPVSEFYPHLKGFCDLTILDSSDPKAHEPSDITFMATPDGVGMKLAGQEIDQGAKVIDYSGDFRFNTREAYAEYAGRISKNPEHSSPQLLSMTKYGLCELHRDELNASTTLVGNPGCFAASCVLGAAPVVKEKIIDFKSIVFDCKSGISGAGKKPNDTFHYPARYENMNAYKLSGHQHVFEVERELGILAGTNINITFTAQVVPMCRGIMTTVYARLTREMGEKELLDLYKEFYKNDFFVRPLKSSASAGTALVRDTNFCDLVVSIDERTNTVRIVSYIDNLMKGQAGSALQNMNLMFGLPETTGLVRPGMYP